MPTSPFPPVRRTHAGAALRSSAQRRISSWSVNTLDLFLAIHPPRLPCGNAPPAFGEFGKSDATDTTRVCICCNAELTKVGGAWVETAGLSAPPCSAMRTYGRCLEE